ncbi:hypothetical protein ACFY0F_34645 [Streptomyces sp. NPDC001544]|uniref:hypothetical protein n=1 Tax=Streptomyces sp. NPDC001544 TaxID=3364584 RepID=UPI0036AEC1A5
MSGLRRPRRANFALPPAEAEQAGEDISPLAFRIPLPGRPSTLVDLTDAKCPLLARELAATIRSMAQVGRRIASRGSVQSYTQVARKMDMFFALRAGGDGAAWTAGRITPQDVDDFETWLYDTAPTVRTAYSLLTIALTMLREIRDARPETLSPALHDRLMFVGRRPRPSFDKRVDAYSPQVAQALREACRHHIREAVRRLTVEADALVAAGDEPLVNGWGRRANVLWYLDRHGPLTVRQLMAYRTRQAGMGPEPWENRQRELHHAVFPTAEDLAALYLLLVLSTGLEPECALELSVDCLKNPTRGYVEIEYIKRRRHGSELNRMRVRDGGVSTPGGLIRLALRLTRRARAHAWDDSKSALWIYWQDRTGRISGGRRHFRPRHAAGLFCERYDLRDEHGERLAVQLKRLRKTYKAEFYRATKGQLPLLARGHSTEVAAAHYADIPALRPLHEAAVADGLTQALEEAVLLRVIPPQREAELQQDAAAAAKELDVGQEEAKRLLDGEMDLWLSSCRDFFNSPFGSAGQACPVPFWSCLDCSNAVITSRKLPAVLAYLDHIEDQRQGMPAEAFELVHGRTRQRILTQVLPAFPEAVLTEARAIAEAARPLEHLPPLLGGIGSRQ